MSDTNEMSKLEFAIVGLVVGIACPLLTFVAFWWTAASFHLYVLRLPTGMIVTAALAGLGPGCLLDVVFLRRWVEKFYTANLRWMIVVYLGFFVVAFACFMGFPVGTSLLGVGAGIYAGRRESHRKVDRSRLAVALRRAAVLTSSITSVAALPVGILGLREPGVAKWLEAVFGLDRSRFYGTAGFVLVGVFCSVLFVMQYWCTRMAGRLAFRIASVRVTKATLTGLNPLRRSPAANVRRL
ncbi:MAG: hypothetical protein ABSH11_02165 [Verrucomicrobiota bacterium]|jgi:hypothetical protein